MFQNPRPLTAAVVALASALSLHASGQTSPAISEAMKKFIDAREIAGAVTLVADDEKILHLAADGLADTAAQTPMRTDSIFWIASMSKPVTATAVMMMQEEGKLSVNDPVSKYLPEFSGEKAGITLRQCLIHSSGLSEVTLEETKDVSTLKDLVPIFTAKPLVFSPGSHWQYSQTGINTAARVVEVVSGLSFPEFLEKRLCGPLGMKDTTFYPDAAQMARLARAYKRNDAGTLEEAGIQFLGGKSLADRGRYPRANGGLFSTAPDYLKFAQMILRGGEAGGRRYLTAESVREMTSVQSGELAAGFVPGSAWGLGWSIARQPQGVTADLSPGSFGHGGLFGTQAWIDPMKKRIYLLLVQRANFTNQGGADGSELRRAFQSAAAK